jgi:hypothetical protein
MKRITDEDMRVGAVKMAEDRSVLYQWFASCLNDIYQGDLYKKWGFRSFEDYLEAELGLSLRTGQPLVTYGSWYRSQPKDVQKKLRELGFFKARLLMGRMNKENVLEVIEHAANTSIKVLGDMEAAAMGRHRGKRTVEIEKELSKKVPEYLSAEPLFDWIYNERELIISYIRSLTDE